MTPYLLALDPGTRHAGLSLWDAPRARVLRAADLETNAASVQDMLGEIATTWGDWWASTDIGLQARDVVLIAEYPQTYARKRVAAEDLEDLRAVVDAVAGWGWARVVRVAPFRWKGNVPKPIHHGRVAHLLAQSGPGLDRVWWAGLGPDARDAVALGQWGLGKGLGFVFPETRT